MPERAMVLLSGGVDSTTLLHVVKHQLDVPEIVAVSFLYAQKHERELAMARHQAAIVGVAEHRELDLSILGAVTANRSALTGDVVPMPNLEELTERQRSQPPTYVPHRNLLFLSLAAATAEGLGMQDVYYGAQAQDEYGYWDCTTAFVEQLNRDRPVTVHAPFVDMSKADVLKIGLALGVDYSHTWTCYRGGERPCGTCPSCKERAAAFATVGVADPLH